MSSRRTMILIAAIIIGALAAYAVVVYVGGIEDRANDNARRVPVVRVGEGGIARGTRGQEAVNNGLLEEAEIAQEFYPETAITPDAIDIILNKAAVSDLAEGQVLVEGMFVDPSTTQITAARRLTEGNVAITISVDTVRGVAGLIVPGDYVNIMVVQPDSCDTSADAAAEGADTTVEAPVLCAAARYLFQAAQVLFVDDDPVLQPGETQQVNPDGTVAAPANTGLITLQLPPQAAQLVASIPGDAFYLTLLPEQYTPTALPPLPAISLLPGEDPAQLTPCGPAGCDFGDTP